MVKGILDRVRAGVPPATAAQAMGVKPATYREWMARGERPHKRGGRSAHATFAASIREAEAHALASAQIVLTGLALGRTVKREVIRTVLTEDGAHEQVVEREYFPPHVGALQWQLERRDRANYAPPAVRDFDAGADSGGVTDADPTSTRQDLDSILDRYAATPAAAQGAGPGDGPPGGGD